MVKIRRILISERLKCYNVSIQWGVGWGGGGWGLLPCLNTAGPLRVGGGGSSA